MATVITKTIGAAGDYTTIALWDAGAGTVYADNLVTNDVIWKGSVLEKLTVTASTSIGGSTTDATRYKWLIASSGQSWQELLGSGRIGGNVSGAGIIAGANANIRYVLAENFVVLENLVAIANSSSYSTSLFALTGTDVVVRGCYGRVMPSTSSVGLAAVSGLRSIFHDNFLVHAGTATGVRMIEMTSDATSEGTAPDVFNNTCMATSTDSTGAAASARGYGIWLNSPAGSTKYIRMRANCFMGVATLFTGTAGVFTSDSGYNATQLTVGTTDYVDKFPTGAGGNKYGGDITGTWSDSNNVFVNTTYASGDMRAISTGVLAGNGVRITSPNNPGGSGGATVYAGTNDKDGYGNTRRQANPWIGAWEDNYTGGTATAFLMQRRLRHSN